MGVRLRAWHPILVIALLSCLATGCGSFRPGNLVLIPNGYVGWVRIFYGETASPPLPRERGAYLIQIGPEGMAKTSSHHPAGYGVDEYMYVSSDGVRTKLKLLGMEDQGDDLVHNFTCQSSPREVTVFFVGPRSVIKTTPRPYLVP